MEYLSRLAGSTRRQDATYALLPQDQDEGRPASGIPRRGRRAGCRPVFVYAFGGFFAVALCYAILRSFRGAPPTPPPMVAKPSQFERTDALIARQSKDVDQAMARYSLRTNRKPPNGYDRWFQRAREKKCLIDEYESLYADFEPFYQIAKEAPQYFRRMVDKAGAIIKERGLGMETMKVRDGRITMDDEHHEPYGPDWEISIGRFSELLPDMNLNLNWRDEPRVVFNYREFGAKEHALKEIDSTPFEHKPAPTKQFFKDKRCFPVNNPTGFTEAVNDENAFLLYAMDTEFTTDLYPLMSQTKITPCFADIMIPTQYYYRSSEHFPHSRPDDISWEEKVRRLYWRGATSGGNNDGSDDYKHWQRYHLQDVVRGRPDIFDVKLTKFVTPTCLEGCDAEKIIKEYNITGPGAPKEGQFPYRYVFDIDGNSFSGRFVGLFTYGSLVFKSTVFSEYALGSWLKPFIHYIPVLPDLSDLIEKVEWAVAHDEEAHRIQQEGHDFVERVLTDDQHDCYHHLVLLEWARLYGSL